MEVRELLELHEEFCAEARAIVEAKNHDYRGGSGDPLANFRGSVALGIDPVMGIMLRQQDKMMRIKTLVEKGELKVKGEGVLDALRDNLNYTFLMYLLIMEQMD